MNEIKHKQNLLNELGELSIAGYSKQMLLSYNRNDISANPFKIKEWDYYLIYNNNFAIALTIADNSYLGLLSATLIDFNLKKDTTKTLMIPFPMGKLNQNYNTKEKLNMPSSSISGDIYFKNKIMDFRFIHDGKNRSLYCYIKNYRNKEDLEATLTITNEPKESMVISTPFNENKKAFYYNQKIVGFKANGKVLIGNQEIRFKPTNSFALLDWGRGVWTYKNTWYWGAATGKIDENIIGFNIGYGFGNTSAATENMLFYNGISHKLDEITFNIPLKENGKEDFLKPWTFTSNNKRFEMNFEPLINRHSDTNIGFLRSNQNQVFGYYNGFVVLDNGTKIEINNFLGFAEKVFNKW